MDAAASATPFVRIADVTMRFGGATALQSLSWELMPGEVHCLMGENGCGKSTTIKVLSGVHRPEPGAHLEIGGRVHERLTPALARELGIQVVWQDLALFPNLSVAENITIEDSLGAYLRPVSPSRRRAKARAVAERLQVELPLDEPVGQLPIGTRQLVAICRGMAADAKLLFLDEPTASLTRAEVDVLLALVRRLAAAGVAVVFVSHKLDEVIEVAQRVTVLRDGRKVGTWPAAELDDRKLTELMTGRAVEHGVRARDVGAAPTVLSVRGLGRSGEYRGIDFDIRAGEVVGLIGLLGAGRTELALSLFGMTRPETGTVELDGRPLRLRSNRDAIRAGIAYVPEDRLRLGLNMRQSVQDNLVLSVLRRLSGRFGWLPRARRAQVAADWRERLRIRIPALDAPVQTLSGGNAQRVVLAKWLATQPKLLILDSPTVGVDIGNRQGLYDIVHELAAQGLAVLLITDEVAEAWAQCDRVLHLRSGALQGSYVPGRQAESELREAVYG